MARKGICSVPQLPHDQAKAWSISKRGPLSHGGKQAFQNQAIAAYAAAVMCCSNRRLLQNRRDEHLEVRCGRTDSRSWKTIRNIIEILIKYLCKVCTQSVQGDPGTHGDSRRN